jgi:hypothetical protein
VEGSVPSRMIEKSRIQGIMQKPIVNSRGWKEEKEMAIINQMQCNIEVRTVCRQIINSNNSQKYRLTTSIPTESGEPRLISISAQRKIIFRETATLSSRSPSLLSSPSPFFSPSPLSSPSRQTISKAL